MNKSNLSTAELVECIRMCMNGECGELPFVTCKFNHEGKNCFYNMIAFAVDRLEALENEKKAAKAMAEDIAGDFVDYVCTGIINPAPYCKNMSGECTNARGWCIDGKCKGFSPKAWRADDE